MTTEEEKWSYIAKLDGELLKGGVILSEWTSSLVRDADTAFCNGAHLSCILAAQAAMECHLRHEYGAPSDKAGFHEVIEHAPVEQSLKDDLHRIRRFRNRWVHVNDPDDDSDLLQRPDYRETELEQVARLAVAAMRKVLYLEQWV